MNLNVSGFDWRGFVWQHVLLLFSLFIMAIGVAVCVRSTLGSSVISSIPLVMETAGRESASVPALTIGEYTYIMNCILVLCQILVLRRRFEPVQLFQLLIGFAFGLFIDINMILTQWIEPESVWQGALTQFAGCSIMGVGIAMEVCCGSVTMPGEGISVAIAKVSGREFPKVKICVDTTLVVIAVALCFGLFGRWQWDIIGPGTLFAMIYVGAVVRWTSKRLGFFENILEYRPGFRRYVYGLARFIKRG